MGNLPPEEINPFVTLQEEPSSGLARLEEFPLRPGSLDHTGVALTGGLLRVPCTGLSS